MTEQAESNTLILTGNLSDASISVSPEANLQKYLAEIRKFPMLSADEEFKLAKNWRDNGDEKAAHKLVTSHLRLVAKIAMKYRGYGLPVGELISEGNIGMMQAIKKFEPDKGFRLATYAMWWIRATIHEYILQSWSLVKIGTTVAQKKLFFNLRKLKAQLQAWDDNELSPENAHEIAQTLNVPVKDVHSMNARIGSGGDRSLNSLISNDANGGASEWQDWLEDESENQEEALIKQDENEYRHGLLVKALEKLDDRERSIIQQRRLSEDPKTLEEISGQFNLTRERVRQIEAAAFTKLQKIMCSQQAGKVGLSHQRT